MPKITVWKCPHTGQLFEDEKEYRAHLRIEQKRRKRQREWQRITDGINEVLEGERKVANMQELCEYVIENNDTYVINAILRDYEGEAVRDALKRGLEMKIPKYKLFAIEATWKESVSNSHNAPRGGYTNWGGKKEDGVRGYPGWHGTMYVKHNDDDKIIIIDPKKTRVRKVRMPTFWDAIKNPVSSINTGSGNGGPNTRVEVILFASDFPEMEKQVTFEKLVDPDNLKTRLDAMGRGVIKNEDIDSSYKSMPVVV